MPEDEFNALRDFVREALARHEAERTGSQVALTNEGTPNTT
jgi:hypothetical protein